MGWAAGAQAGSQMARDWIDTYNKAREKRDITRVQDEKPQGLVGFTQADSDMSSQYAANPSYDVSAERGLDGTPRFKIQPLQGSMENAAAAAMGPSLITTADDAMAYAQRPGVPLASAQPEDKSYLQAMRPRYIDAKPVTDYLGKRYEGGLTDTQAKDAKQRAIADVVSRYRPEAGLQMLNSMDANTRANAAEGREEDLHPYDVARAQREQTLGDINVDDAQEKQASEQRLRGFFKAYGENPELQRMMPQELEKHAYSMGLSVPEVAKATEMMTGLSEGTIKARDARVQADMSGMSLDDALKYHGTMFNDGVHFERRSGPNGSVMLQLVSDDSGKPVGTPRQYADEAHAMTALQLEARSPTLLATYRDTQEDRGLKNAGVRAETNYKNAAATNQIADANLRDRTDPNLRSNSLSLGMGMYKKNAQGAVWVEDNGRMVLKNGTFDGTQWVDTSGGKPKPFTGIAVPAAMVNMDAIDKQAAANAKGMVGQPKQQLTPDGKTQRWTEQDAFEYQRAQLLRQRLTDYSQGVVLGDNSDALPTAGRFGGGGGATAAGPAAQPAAPAPAPAAAPRPGGLGYDAIMAPQVAPQQGERPTGAMQREWQRIEYERRRQAAAARSGQPLQR